MKRLIILGSIVTWLCGIGFFLHARPPVQDAVRDAVQEELAKFQGTWEFVKVEVEGTQVSKDELKQLGIMVVKGNKFSFEKGDLSEGTFKVLPNLKPKGVNVSFTDGPDKGKTIHGIYEFGKDTYKVCFSLKDNKQRPTTFATVPESGLVLEVLKRRKP